jgi:hypothetical protein
MKNKRKPNRYEADLFRASKDIVEKVGEMKENKQAVLSLCQAALDLSLEDTDAMSNIISALDGVKASLDLLNTAAFTVSGYLVNHRSIKLRIARHFTEQAQQDPSSSSAFVTRKEVAEMVKSLREQRKNIREMTRDLEKERRNVQMRVFILEERTKKEFFEQTKARIEDLVVRAKNRESDISIPEVGIAAEANLEEPASAVKKRDSDILALKDEIAGIEGLLATEDSLMRKAFQQFSYWHREDYRASGEIVSFSREAEKVGFMSLCGKLFQLKKQAREVRTAITVLEEEKNADTSGQRGKLKESIGTLMTTVATLNGDFDGYQKAWAKSWGYRVLKFLERPMVNKGLLTGEKKHADIQRQIRELTNRLSAPEGITMEGLGKCEKELRKLEEKLKKEVPRRQSWHLGFKIPAVVVDRDLENGGGGQDASSPNKRGGLLGGGGS